MRTEIKTDNEALFNYTAHEIVRQILNIAEGKLLERQITDPAEIEEWLCRFYIEQVAGIINGASNFLQGEATAGAEIFLIDCVDGSTDDPHPIRKRLTPPRLSACGNQISFHSSYYFPRYNAILTQRYIEELHKPNDAALIGSSRNGIFHLAAASLPGVQEELNRKLRRRGLDYDAIRVPAAHLARRMRAH